jgi:quercetin dioxygenase-like cupin family protein
MANLQDLQAIEPRSIWEGVRARVVGGENVDLAVLELEAGAVVPEHAHANEQLGIVITGSVTFRIANEEGTLGPGGTWRVPPGLPHEVHAGDAGAVVIDVFAPTREDWVGIPTDPPASPLWPR